MKWLLAIIRMIGLATFAIGLTTCIGYWLRLENMYRWEGDVGMALNTGIGFLSVGVGLLLGTFAYEVRHDKTK